MEEDDINESREVRVVMAPSMRVMMNTTSRSSPRAAASSATSRSASAEKGADAVAAGPVYGVATVDGGRPARSRTRSYRTLLPTPPPRIACIWPLPVTPS